MILSLETPSTKAGIGPEAPTGVNRPLLSVPIRSQTSSILMPKARSSSSWFLSPVMLALRLGPLLVRLKLGRGLDVRDKTVPEKGEAMTMVLGECAGGGVGESVRKSGWICASVPVGTLGRLIEVEVVGRDNDGPRRE